MNHSIRRYRWTGATLEALDTVCRYLLLSTLWTVGTALVVTAPAATSALVETARGGSRGDHGPVLTTFLANMRRTVRTSTAAVAILLPIGALLAVNFAIVPLMREQGMYVAAVLVSIAIPFLLFSANLIPATAGEDLRVRQAYQRTLERIVNHPFAAIVTALIAAGGAVLIYLQPLSAFIIAAPAARLVVAVHDRSAAQPARVKAN
ncbi:DUF624 domain-containing protein [Nonomuraea sp. NPDC026600]|uniref:DUF624 domain-containing protein n=1 Tax=Nonomuraea sp. NPDC026600 TaxID=3155363 RepID=UPI00340E0635